MFIQGGSFIPDSIVYNKVAAARCDHQKSKLCAVEVADGFWVVELWVRQVKIGSKSYFGSCWWKVKIATFYSSYKNIRNTRDLTN